MFQSRGTSLEPCRTSTHVRREIEADFARVQQPNRYMSTHDTAPKHCIVRTEDREIKSHEYSCKARKGAVKRVASGEKLCAI